MRVLVQLEYDTANSEAGEVEFSAEKKDNSITIVLENPYRQVAIPLSEWAQLIKFFER